MVKSNIVEFSKELEGWLKSSKPKTLNKLLEIFSEKAYAVSLMLLLLPTALPLPTGGVTYIFEGLALILCAQMIISRGSIWVPKSWGNTELGHTITEKFLPRLIGFIKKAEKFSNNKFKGLGSKSLVFVIGLVLILFIISATLAPPFSGLDTLPSLGVVVICMSMIVEDIRIFTAGLIIGCIGLAVELYFWSEIVKIFANA